MEGCGWRARASKPGGWTGGGMRAPFRDDLASLERSEAAVEGREEVVGCLVLEGSSFTGGAGMGSSSAGASMPSGPRGPMESSRVSRVVDCVRLAWRREGRVFEGASLMPGVVEDVGDEDCSAAVD
jgi:hypothetical protein